MPPLAGVRRLETARLADRLGCEVETMNLEAVEAEYHALISSVEFAYAFGHGCSIDGGHPRFVAIRERADQLLSIIREHIA